MDQNSCYTKYFEIEYFKEKNYKNTFTITVTTIVLGHHRPTTLPCYARHRVKESNVSEYSGDPPISLGVGMGSVE